MTNPTFYAVDDFEGYPDGPLNSPSGSLGWALPGETISIATTMSKATKFTKSTDGVLVLEPGVQFQRKTNFPANWSRIKIGLFGSLTNLSDLNGSPHPETLLNIDSVAKTWFVGLSNGVGLPGDAGNRFMGLRGSFSDACYSSNMGLYVTTGTCDSDWSINSFGPNSQLATDYLVSDGATWSGNYINTGPWNLNCGDPTASANGLFLLLLGIDLLDLSGPVRISTLNTDRSKLSDPTDSALLYELATSNLQSRDLYPAQPWWSSSSPVGLSYFTFRFPFLQNRFRLHNIMLLNQSSQNPAWASGGGPAA